MDPLDPEVSSFVGGPPGRAPLFGALRRLLTAAMAADAADAGPPAATPRRTRRQLLREAAAVSLGALAFDRAAPGALALGTAPRIAIVGAGLSGLVAAWFLRRAGLRATLYESAERVGGRVHTLRDGLGPGLQTELGGEFIDTGHATLRALAREFELEFHDLRAPAERRFRDTFVALGRRRTEAEVLAALRPLAARVRADRRRLGERITFREHTPEAVRLDRLSIREYLEGIDLDPWLRVLVEVAYTSEYGLDAERQSALNLILLIGTETTGELALYGGSDERFVVRGGNARLVEALAARLPGQIRLGHRLEALEPLGTGYRLTFAVGAGVRTAAADIVLLTLPFTRLREAALRVPLPPAKRRAIAELGYGTNAKIIAGVRRRVWRERGDSGALLGDLPFQCAWDSTRRRAPSGPGGGPEAGSLTFFLGGGAGLEAGEGAPEERARAFLRAAEPFLPGVVEAAAGRPVVRFHWPSYPHVRASYASYLPGQWTSLAGAEGMPVGRLFFAGEHTSLEFQGFMEGAAASGVAAARAILRAAGAPVAPRPR